MNHPFQTPQSAHFNPPALSDRVLRLPEVRHRSGLSRTQIYAKAKTGEFPRPIKIGGRASGWIESEISGWIEERKASARAGTQGQEAARA